jgi:hypothetical protein
MRRLVTGIAVLCLLAACGDKVPQSEAAKKIGDIPKQTVGKAAAGVNNALKQGAGRLKEDDEKQ